MRWIDARVMLCSMVLGGCASIFGNGAHTEVYVQVPVNTTVVHVYTGDTIATAGPAVQTVPYEVKSARNHAYRFDTDSGSRYAFVPWSPVVASVLNIYSPLGVGFMVDHLLEADGKPSAENVWMNTKAPLVPGERRQDVDDSLRAITGATHIRSLIDRRERHVFIASASLHFSSLSFLALSYGLTWLPTPWLGIGYEISWQGYPVIGDSINRHVDLLMHTAVIRLLEPNTGLYLSPQVGYGAYKNGMSDAGLPLRDQGITYGLGVGFMHQWGGMELRHTRTGAWLGRNTDHDDNIITLHYILQIPL